MLKYKLNYNVFKRCEMRRQKWMALITALCMLFCMGASFALPANAEAAKQEIYTAEDFLAIAAGDLGGNYIQKADINLKGVGYAPIGSVNQPFTGTYDGNGYTISGLYLESDQPFQGLFGVNNGTIRNVTLTEDCFISGSSHVGAIAGRNNGTIEGCLSYAAVSHSAVAEAGGNTYSVMSQNLCQWGEDALSGNPNFEDGVAYSRKVVMQQRILNADPDILLFQEVYFVNRTQNGKTILAWSTYLKNTFGSTYNFYGDYRSDSDKEGILVGIKKSKFDYVDDGCFWLSTKPDAPRSQQVKAWDASHVRTCHWVLMRDKATGQEIAAYSTHLDVGGALARENGAKVIADKMAALKKDHPNALFVVGGDFNENPGKPGYVNIDNALGGMVDDGRYVAETVENNYRTSGDINDLTFTGNHYQSIDFIFADTANTEVEYFRVMNDNYFDLRPSDHQGVLIKVRALENNFVGGIAGSNNGTVSAVLSAGAFDGGTAEGSGALLGACDYNSAVKVSYATDANLDRCIALEGISELKALPAAPSYDVVANLNNQGGFFDIVDGKYCIVRECTDLVLADVVVNGITSRLPVGSVFEPDLEIPEGALALVNGKPYDGKAVVVPAEGLRIIVATPAMMVTSAVDSGDYTVSSEAEWMHVYNNLSRFKSRNVTIHLQSDIDLSLSAATNFKGFTNPAFSFDGHGYTIKNWGSKTSAGGVGLFRVSAGDGGMRFIKDVTLENCHVSGTNTAVLYSATHGNGGFEGLPTALSITGITLNNCSARATTQSCALLLSRYGVAGEAATITIRDCKITNSYLDTNSSLHMGLIVGKPRSADSGTANFNITDCYLANNEMVNVKDGAGFVCGTAELSTNVNISNVGIFNNRVSGASGSEFHYICGDNYCSGKISADKLMIAGNTVSATSVYMISGVETGTASEVPTNYYSDAAITAVAEGVSATYSQTPLYAFQRGAVGYFHNQGLEDPAFYWAMDEANLYRPASAEGRVGAVSLEDGELFLNGGIQYDLGAPDKGKWLVVEGESTLQGNILTVAGDITIVSQVQRVSQDTSPEGSGDYTIEDITDWMALYNNLSNFRSRNNRIHLLCDIDLSVAEASGFKGFANPAFSFDGHNHTIKNWGTKTARKAYQALFYATEGAGGMDYIKNLKVSNCHVGAASGFGSAAIVFSSTNGNSGFEGLATEFTLENIHIQGCSLQSPGESSAILLNRYGVADSAFDVHIKNCSVVGCELDAGGSAHKGMLIGKPRCTESGTANFNITDCYVADNTITNAINGAGALFGTAESSSTVMNLTNVAAANNTVTAANGYTEGAYLGYSDGGTVNLDRVIINGNTVNAENKYLIATNQTGNQKLTLGTVYSDITDLTAVLEVTNTNPTLAPQAALIASGEAAYLMNKQCTGEMYWWTESGKVKGGDQDHRATKLMFSLADGTRLKTAYANGCGTADLSMSEDPNATFATYGNGTVSGNTLQVPAGATEVYVVVTPGEDSPLDPTYVMPVSKVSAPVTMGTYSVSDIDEWMYLFDHADYFANESITIVLTADLDLSDSKAAKFAGFIGAQFSLNGDGHTLRNWHYTTASGNYRGGLFMEYLGKSIKNLTIEGFNVGGTYGRSILVAGYNGTGNLTIENVHVKNSTLDTSATGGHMGVFLSRAMQSAASGASIVLRNCSVIDTDLQNSAGGRINNSGLLIGTAYQGFSYTVENCMIQGCKVNTDTGAGGFVVGAVEGASSKMRMNRVAIYDCSGRVASTNDCPGVFFGEMSQKCNVTIANCMAANLSVEGGKSLSFLRHSDIGSAVTISVSNCLTDFTPLEIIPTDNAAGTTGTNKGAIAGATQISSAAFKSGEAAWRSTKGATANRWWVDDSFNQYPTFYKEEGYGVPYQVTFGSAAFYTNGSGILPASAEPYLANEDGLWKNGEEQVTAATVFTQDATLTLEGHTFLAQNAVPDGEGFHKIPCSDSGCSAEKRVVCSFTEGITQSAKEGVHYQNCVCGNQTELSCSYDVVSGQDGTHYEKCKECGKQKAAAACSFTYTALSDGKHTKKCSVCQYSAEEKCAYEIVSRGDGYHYEKCNHCGAQKEAVACTLSYIEKANDLHAQKCGICSYETEAVACDYKVSSIAGTNTHMKQCTECLRIKATENCEYTFISKEDGTHYEKCKECGAEKQAAACSFSYTQKEGDLHTKECKDCHYTADEACAYRFVDRGDGYHYEKCASCGKQNEAVACTYGNYVHVAGTNTHQETCFDCGHVVAGAECIMRAEAEALPAFGESFVGKLSCTKGCGNTYQNIAMKSGDLNNDGKVSMADVVTILQVVCGIRSADSVHCALGNAHQADGVQENGGLTTNDAVMLLRKIIGK